MAEIALGGLEKEDKELNQLDRAVFSKVPFLFGLFLFFFFFLVVLMMTLFSLHTYCFGLPYFSHLCLMPASSQLSLGVPIVTWQLDKGCAQQEGVVLRSQSQSRLLFRVCLD